MIKSAFFKKRARKSRYFEYLALYLPKDLVKLPPVPCSTRWNTWFEAVIYHSAHLHMYHGFFSVEASKGLAVETIIELTGHKEIYAEIELQAQFVTENCQRLVTSLTSLEATHDPLALSAYNIVEELRRNLHAGSTKTTFDPETDKLMLKLKEAEKTKAIKYFNEVFAKSLKKLETHIDMHPALPMYKEARVFDPKLLPSISHDISDYSTLLSEPSADITDEFLIYVQHDEPIPIGITLPELWKSWGDRFPLLSKVALDIMWLPVASVDVEWSFSQYKHILNDRRENLTETNTKQLVMLYYNGDIEKRF